MRETVAVDMSSKTLLRGPAMASKSTPSAAAVRALVFRFAALYGAFYLGMAFQHLSSLSCEDEIETLPLLRPVADGALSTMATQRGGGVRKPEAVPFGNGKGGEDDGDNDGDNADDDDNDDMDGVVDIRPQGRRRTWDEVRANLLETYDYCRMPGFVIEDRPRVYLSKGWTFGNKWRERERVAAMARDEEGRAEFMKERRRRRRRMELERQNKEEVKPNESRGEGGKHDKDWYHLTKEITYVHVGKAGGSSSSCNVRKAFPTVKKHCGTKYFPADGPLESAISRQVDCYTHYNDNMHCYDVNKSFIINTRNPVHRIMSWYLYEHLWNEPWNNPGRAKTNPRCGVYMVSICFGSLNDLATVGLSGPPPPRDARLRVGTDLTPQECSRWAWAAVRGDVPATYHNVWNYDWYASRILEDDTNEIFNLRVEHNDYDWQTIDKMVGGTGDPLPNGDAPKNVAADKEELPLSDKTVSKEGVQNLCRALCDEIQIYKRLLTKAANLNEVDVRTSMEALRRTCPEETDVAPRDCRQG